MCLCGMLPTEVGEGGYKGLLNIRDTVMCQWLAFMAASLEWDFQISRVHSFLIRKAY